MPTPHTHCSPSTLSWPMPTVPATHLSAHNSLLGHPLLIEQTGRHRLTNKKTALCALTTPSSPDSPAGLIQPHLETKAAGCCSPQDSLRCQHGLSCRLCSVTVTVVIVLIVAEDQHFSIWIRRKKGSDAGLHHTVRVKGRPLQCCTRHNPHPSSS